MERADISSEKVELVKSLFKILYKSGLNRTQALEQIKQQNEEENSGITAEILKFVSSSNRGIA
jgi:UDP-N-acetylglucosamine acyltransferase